MDLITKKRDYNFIVYKISLQLTFDKVILLDDQEDTIACYERNSPWYSSTGNMRKPRL